MQRDAPEPDKATTAVFYSISNCQRGLAGVSFGNFLIKQVVQEISPRQSEDADFCHAVAGAGLRAVARSRAQGGELIALSPEDRAALEGLDRPGWWQFAEAREPLHEPLMRAPPGTILRAKNRRGLPLDSVARFHLGNGAGSSGSTGSATRPTRESRSPMALMVNYLYDLDHIEKNHEAFAEGRTVVASNSVKRLQRQIELVPVAG